ncbi:MAG: DUF4336 domain-containing protein [Nannocystaceae bacterium]|nr:DUF4336 domain-containing protein [bacterium]
MQLQRLHEDVWTASAPQTMLGLHLGTRMTVVRLPSGGLWVHSPIAVDEEGHEALRDLGTVEHIVAPNLYHHLHVGPMAAAHPGAAVHARPRLRKKRPDLHIDADLGDAAPSAWGGALTPVHIGGTMLDEVVFLHAPSRLLISCDLVENFTSCPHLLTRMYLKVGGIYQKPGLSRPLRLVFRDRPRAREAIDYIIGLPFDGIVLSHGDLITEGGPDVVAASYAWLG